MSCASGRPLVVGGVPVAKATCRGDGKIEDRVEDCAGRGWSTSAAAGGPGQAPGRFGFKAEIREWHATLSGWTHRIIILNTFYRKIV